MDKLKVCFLGTGSMGSSVLKGLLASGHHPKLISATTSSEASAASLRELGISALSVEEASDANSLLAADSDLIILGVKPYALLDLIDEIAAELPTNAIVVSMAAGIELATMAQRLPGHPELIRSMPNTPALVGSGVTGLAAADSATARSLDVATWLFEQVGSVVQVREDQINALSAISGSGPAWIYFLIEKWHEVALAQGFTEEQAKLLVEKTLIGSAKLLELTGEEPSKLRRDVTSPGGTTARIIETLDQADLTHLFDKALRAAVARAQELANPKG
jgi:pyrroline-5-carboxylate reductase